VRLGAYLLDGPPAQILQLRTINVFALETFMYTHTHIYIYIFIYIHIYIYIHTYILTYIIYTYTHTHACMYYVYLYIYIYIFADFSAVLYYYSILPIQSLLLHFVCSAYSLKGDVVIQCLYPWETSL